MSNLAQHLPFFEKLQTSISIALFKQQSEEPQYEALDSFTDESARFSRLSEYATDILRIFRELQLVKSLVVNLPQDDFFTQHDSTKEDYVMYHQGHFLDLVHQLKDKLTHFVHGIVHKPPFIEKKKVNPLTLAEKEEVKIISGLPELLRIWSQAPEAEHAIASTLRRRTNYHHFRNRLHLSSDFLDVKLFRTMQHENVQKILTAEGKKRIEEKGRTGFEKWHSDVERRIGETLEEVRVNIEKISETLLEKLELPNMEKDGKEIFEKYFAMSEQLKIKSIANNDYKKTPFYPGIATIEKFLPLYLKENLVSLYLTGSTTRGDAVYGLSDINIVVVIRDEATMRITGIKDLIEVIASRTGENIHYDLYTMSEFKKDEQRLLRFICQTDGLLICGVGSVDDEKFPKPGLELVCLFKKNAKKIIDSVLERVSQTPPPDQDEVSVLGRIVAKVGLRAMYWAVLADTAKYERSINGMYKAILQQFPDSKRMTDIFYGVASGDGTVDLENLKNILTGFETDSSLGGLLAQLDEKCEQLKNRKEY
jgi:hypothetical protein